MFNRLITPAVLIASVLGATVVAADPRGTQPELPCSQEGRVESHHARSATSIVFTNGSAETIFVHWLNYSGQRVHYATLAPGASYDQGTFVTHPWIVTDTAGTCLAGYRAHGTPSVALYGD